MASVPYDPENRREVYVETPDGNWESHLRYAEHDELVDEGIPVARLPMPPSGTLN